MSTNNFDELHLNSVSDANTSAVDADGVNLMDSVAQDVTSEPNVVEEVLPIATIAFDVANMRRYFTKPGIDASIDVRDIIIFVRSKYPNPRQRVVLKCETPLPVSDLQDAFIYVDGINEEEARAFDAIGQAAYCPIEITKEHMSMEGYGIQRFVESFCQHGNISSCEVLIYGDNIDDLLEVRQYLQDVGTFEYTPMFQASVVEKLKLLDNGLDLSSYAKRMSQALDRKSLSVSFIRTLLDEIGKEIEGGKTLLQCLEDTRSYYVKWLTLALTQKHNLTPVYVGSYISEYVNLKVAYPLDKLSMYERFKFVMDLPTTVGYIGKYHVFQCVYGIMKKIYPVPAMAFDLQDNVVIAENLERFEFEKLELFDWRVWFKESKNYYVTRTPSGAASRGAGALSTEASDRGVDESLRKIFLEMTEAAGGNIFMSVRNSVLAKYEGRLYILYYSQMLGLMGVATSEHFGRQPLVVTEENFHQLIDVRLIASLQKSREQKTDSARREQFTQLMTVLPQTFRTAIPLDLLMCCVLVGQNATELSYYDMRLRCDKNVLPIITHEDAGSSRKQTIFDHLNILDVGKDKIAGPAISSFGSIDPECGYLNQVPVSIDSFRGWRLL